MSGLALLAAFVRRDLTTAVSYRFPFAIQTFTALLTVAFLFYLSKVIDDAALDLPQLEAGYFGFAVLGVVLLGVFQAGLTALGIRFRQEQTTGTLETLLSSPAPRWAILYGSAAYEVLRELVFALLAVGVALLVFDLPFDTSPASVAVALAAAGLALCVFASAGVLVAAFTVAFKQSTAFVDPLVTVIAIMAGTYFPVEVLPQPIEALADLLPLTWALEIIRDALLFDTTEPGLLLALAGAAAASIPLVLGVFALALDHARKQGSLTHY